MPPCRAVFLSGLPRLPTVGREPVGFARSSALPLSERRRRQLAEGTHSCSTCCVTPLSLFHSFLLLGLSFSSRKWLDFFFFLSFLNTTPMWRPLDSKMTIREFSNDFNVHFEGLTFLWGSPPRTFWPPVLGGCVRWLFCFAFHHTEANAWGRAKERAGNSYEGRTLNFHAVLKVQRTTERSHVAGTGWRRWGHA